MWKVAIGIWQMVDSRWYVVDGGISRKAVIPDLIWNPVILHQLPVAVILNLIQDPFGELAPFTFLARKRASCTFYFKSTKTAERLHAAVNRTSQLAVAAELAPTGATVGLKQSSRMIRLIAPFCPRVAADVPIKDYRLLPDESGMTGGFIITGSQIKSGMTGYKSRGS